LPAIDVLVSNVAVSPHFGSFFETDDSSWDKIFEINIKAAFFLTKAGDTLEFLSCGLPCDWVCAAFQEALPYLRFGSSVCYVSSVGGYEPAPLIGAYTIRCQRIVGLACVELR
jgi:dehydrogenase/reductase SDR family member 4